MSRGEDDIWPPPESPDWPITYPWVDPPPAPPLPDPPVDDEPP